MKHFTLLFFLLLCLACRQNEKTISEPEKNNVSTEVAKSDTIEIIRNPFDDSLRLYFEAPFDFYALKKRTQHMLDGGSPDMDESYFHPNKNPEAILYTYMCLEKIGTKNFTKDDLLFATWKPWRTQQQKNYETDNEILVGIRCKINWEGLERSNFVGMHIDSIKARFGEPHAVDNTYSTFYNSASPDRPDDIINTTSIYFRNDKILLLNEKNKKINWFKYYWWKEKIIEIDSLPKEIFEWR